MSSIIQNSHFQTNATLFFSHENLISKLWTYLHLFDTFETYYSDGDHVCLPTSRQWKASIVLPFGANFAATLFKCPREKHQDSQQDSFKILTLVNEAPVKIRGCSSALCDYGDFVAEYGHTVDSCDLNEICRI